MNTFSAFPENFTLSSAIVVLQTTSSSFENRLNSLRYLHLYLKDEVNVSQSIISRINQLMMENILKMIMNDDKTPDIRKRQLIKAECFLMLSSLLSSQTLFSDGLKDINQENQKYLSEKEEETSVAADSNNSIEIKEDKRRIEDYQKSKNNNLSTPIRHFKKSRNRNRPSTTSNISTNHQPQQINILKDAIEKNPHRSLTRKPYLQPRLSIMYNSEYKAEHLVPGVEPTNWVEVDRKIGYQKSRLWFPTPAPSISFGLLPQERSNIIAPDFNSNSILNEYLQMKAMLSYVGDHVLKKRGISDTTGFPKKGEKSYINTKKYDLAVKEAVQIWSPLVGVHLPKWIKRFEFKKKKKPTSYESLYNTSANDTAATIDIGTIGLKEKKNHSVTTPNNSNIYSQLRHAFLPTIKPKNNSRKVSYDNSITLSSTLTNPTSKKPITASSSSSSTFLTSDEHSSEYRPSAATTIAPGDVPGVPSEEVKRSVMITKGILRRLLKKELFCQNQTKDTLRRTLEDLTGRDSLESHTVHSHQHTMTTALRREGDSVRASALAIQSLMRETIKLHYASLPSRYLLVIEGSRSKVNPRTLVAKALHIFWNTKYLSTLALAMGIWKIFVSAARSISHIPLYARFASLHMMLAWLTNFKLKRLRFRVFRFRSIVTSMIFAERHSAVLPIQTIYRRWRDRRYLTALHEVSPYNGPLSDIYLANKRPKLRYFIPNSIRSTRRMYWIAAVIIQKYFRRMSLWREYKRHRRRILLLQSFCRMIPRKMEYRRLKRATIKCQAWMRRTFIRKLYLRLKAATIIVQKYVRRYLSVLRRFYLLDVKWKGIEDRMSAAIHIQCKWRIYKARRATQHKKQLLEKMELAALLLQKTWYRVKGGYHTFLLMSCYRVRDIEDSQQQVVAWRMGRFHAARRIQRAYKIHYFKRIISSVIKVQCWFRGRLGYRLVDILRVEKWAARKLHHWARGMMKFKHKCSRMIAHCWFRAGEGRLLRHLQYRAQVFDAADDRRSGEVRYLAASRIQAVVKGIWTRRWYSRHLAAMVIQKPLRLFLAKKRWLREVHERLMVVVRNTVNYAVSRAIIYRTRQLVKEHSKMLIRPQAVIRGFLIRRAYHRACLHAYKSGLAVVMIQRFWKASGAFVKAVQEVMALKRMGSNPFKNCYYVHEVLHLMFVQTNKYYNVTDPRAGMRVSTFLYRIGLLDILPLFSKKDYRYVTDLLRLDLPALCAMYSEWFTKQTEKDKARRGNTAPNNNKDTKDTKDKTKFGRSSAPPKMLFQELLAYLEPPIPARKKVDLDLVQKVQAVPEVMSAIQFDSYFGNLFLRKFGKGYLARAENISKAIIEKEWNNYNGFKSFGAVITQAQINRAMILSGGPADLKPHLEALSARSNSNILFSLVEERSWDMSRLSQCALILQLAVDRARLILPPGIIFDMLDTIATKVAIYRRKFKFMLVRVRGSLKSSGGGAGGNFSPQQRPSNQLKNVNLKDKDGAANSNSGGSGSELTRPKSRSSNVSETPRSTDSSRDSSPPKRGASSNLTSLPQPSPSPSGNKKTNERGRLAVAVPTGSSSDTAKNQAPAFASPTPSNASVSNKSPFAKATDAMNGHFFGSENDIELEMHLNICKAYLEVLIKLQVVCNGIMELKRIWRRKCAIRDRAKKKLQAFYTATKSRYIADRQEDKVKISWEKFRKQEAMAKKLQDIRQRREARLAGIKQKLQWITKHGWSEALDSNGNVIWKNASLKSEQYAPPVYEVPCWDACVKIQRRARKFIVAVRERKRLKQEAMEREIAEAQAKWEEELKTSQQYVAVRFKISSEDVVSKYSSLYEQPDSNANIMTSMNRRNKKDDVENIPPPAANNPTATSTKPAGNPTTATTTATTTGEVEGREVQRSAITYPFWLRFEVTPLKSDSWALHLSEDETMYEQVFVFRIRKQGKFCDMRTVKNEYRRNVSTSRIVYIRLSVGSEVEARFKGRSAFYRGVVTSVYESQQGPVYTILYDDGEKEHRVPRDCIRSTKKTIETFLRSRSIRYNEELQMVRRKAHYESLRRERAVARVEQLKRKADEFATAWSSAHYSTAKPGASIRKMCILSTELNRLKFSLKPEIRYSKHALQFPWIKMSEEQIKAENQYSSGLSDIVVGPMYYNPRTKERSKIPPLYSLTDHFYAKKIQSIWAVRQAKKRIKKILWNDSVSNIVRGCIQKYQLHSFIGYQLEGATIPFLLRRAGYWEIADCMNDANKHRPGSLKSLDMKHLVHLPAEKYKFIGVIREYDCKRFKQFQDWWCKTSEKSRIESLAFLNYYADPFDPRDMADCLLASSDLLYAKLLKAFPKNATRVKNMSYSLAHNSYPITKMQLDSFSQKYYGKSALAQENIGELLEKPTLHSYVEEGEAYTQLKQTAQRVGTILANMGIATVARKIRDAIEQAALIVREQVPEGARKLITGPEAKAALLIRRNVMDYLERCERAVRVIQTQGRGLIFRYKWMRLILLRRKMVKTIQRVFRGSRGRRDAQLLRSQQWSQWEQLWDERHQVLYYFNITTNESVYEDPGVPFRPLVRHLRTSALMQAWPFLDHDPKYGRSAPPTASAIPTHLLCMVCEVRKAIRTCDDCEYTQKDIISTTREYSFFKKDKKKSAIYCFTCFTRRHSDDPMMRRHNFHDITEDGNRVEQLTYLVCCECGDPATRQCLGMLSDDHIEELCDKLRVANSTDWFDILKESKVGGEKKLSLMLAQIEIDNNIAGSPFLSSIQLQSVRSALERTRAECDECYCTTCYKNVHSGGKRANHLWRGFEQYSAICSVCSKCAAELHCTECDSIFCSSCSKVFHGKGRKKKHQFTLITETCQEHQTLCRLCERRVSSTICLRCSTNLCESCYECNHKPACDKEGELEAESSEAEADGQASRICILCGEQADKKCIQCGDLYCSRTWMGNPGCFAKFHHKGKRMLHSTEPLPALLRRSSSTKTRGKAKILRTKSFRDKRALKKYEALSSIMSSTTDAKRTSLPRLGMFS